jgi:hypothetical protein
MIKLRSAEVVWNDGHADGVVRDTRVPHDDDGLLPGVSMALGADQGGPSVMLSITHRLYPRKAPVHKHKTDTFRMALGEPIVVGRTSYAHGEFRLQEVDTYYGPELWTDEVGTNQMLIMADRRGGKPYLTTPELQALSDMGRSAEEDLGEGYRQHDRDAEIVHVLRNNFGATVHAGHWDGGFTDTSAWPQLGDGTRLGVIAMGPVDEGPLLLCWDRPPDGHELPGFVAATDLLRLVVEGSVCIEDAGGETTTLGRLGFRLQQEGTTHGASRPGPGGLKELWFLADRRGVPALGREVEDQIASVVA